MKFTGFITSKRIMLSCFFVLLVLTLTTSSLWAANIYVSSFGGGTGLGDDPDNPATLPNALNLAKGNGKDDVLYLKAEAYYFSGTFSYTPDLLDYTKSIKLIGGWNSNFTYKSLDPLVTRLYGGNPGRIFNITANTSGMNFSVSIENITFQNGNVTSANGAAISATNSNGGIINRLSISHCYFLQNTATGTGGAIYANCYAEITDSTFTSNLAYAGGAITLVPPESVAPFTVSLSPLIERCSFDNNVLSNNLSSGSDIYSTVSPVIWSCSFRGKDDGTNNGGAAIHHRRHSPENYPYPWPTNCGTPSGTPEYAGKLTVINWYRSKVFTFGCCGQNQTRNQIWEFRPRRTGIFSRAIV
jgi:predicted outer membrane repeat protein